MQLKNIVPGDILVVNDLNIKIEIQKSSASSEDDETEAKIRQQLIDLIVNSWDRKLLKSAGENHSSPSDKYSHLSEQSA